jgi:hypothetical protein
VLNRRLFVDREELMKHWILLAMLSHKLHQAQFVHEFPFAVFCFAKKRQQFESEVLRKIIALFTHWGVLCAESLLPNAQAQRTRRAARAAALWSLKSDRSPIAQPDDRIAWVVAQRVAVRSNVMLGVSSAVL